LVFYALLLKVATLSIGLYHKDMINLTLHNPTKIIFGVGVLSQLATEASKIGKHPLVMYGKSSAKTSGLSDKVKSMLSSSGLKVTEFFGVEPNPRDDTCDRAASLGRQAGCDAVIAVGGGSVMDAAKLTSACIVSGKPTWDYVTRVYPVEKALPIIMVPTLAATGSDFNSGAVITNWTMKQKFGAYSPLFFPTVSIIDPVLTTTCNRNVTAWGGVDIMIHVLETYLGTNDAHCPIPDYFSEGIVKTVMKYLPLALADGNDIVARTQLSWASAVALSGMPNGGRPGGFLLHWMEHVMSAHFDIPHGLGLAYLLVPTLSYFKENFPERHYMFTNNLMPDPAGFLESIGCDTTLEKLGIPGSSVPTMVDDLFVQKGKGDEMPGYPSFDKKWAEKIYKGRF